MTTGTVFNIQRYSIHDGPGIRTTVFLKGCPLNCWWCHNPEGQSEKKEIMFFENRCIKCRNCINSCKSNAISIKKGEPVTDKNKCILCEECTRNCPVSAREMIGKEMTADEVIKEVEKDSIFYEESGGGVTFSGGEPLMQAEFLNILLDNCKQKGISTALDTSGYFDWEFLNKFTSKVDLFLYDLKIMDDERHKKFTGVSNYIILENLKKLTLIHTKIFIRIPIIFGINDDHENIEDIGRFLLPLKIAQVHLMPYHQIGKDKHKRLGRIYKLSGYRKISDEKLIKISENLKNFGMEIKIGG